VRGIALLCGALLLGGCTPGDIGTTPDAGTRAPDAGGAVNVPGRREHVLEVDGVERRAVVYVGAGAEDRDAPVVFMFHGTTGDGARVYDTSGWREEADAAGFIAVFPTSLTWCFKEDDNRDGDYDDPGEARITTKWTNGKLGTDDGFPLCTPAELAQFSAAKQSECDHPVVDDVRFVDALVSLLGANHRVDPKRLYVSGFSNGASFTARLVVERSTVFAAAAIGSGKLAVEPLTAERPMGVVHWMGTEDGKFVPAGMTVEVSAQMLEQNAQLDAAFIAPLRTVLGLAGTPAYQERTVGGTKVGTFRWTQGPDAGSPSYAYSFIDGMTHRYPAEAGGFSAARYGWSFFSTQALP
jgi:poly(3-hydroxybutyrate) depolymerase